MINNSLNPLYISSKFTFENRNFSNQQFNDFILEKNHIFI